MERIKYIDTLKFVAIFSIIMLHIGVIWGDIGILHVNFYNLNEIVRFGVPLFLMITGCLAFNGEIDLPVFLRKKVERIVYPVVFFTIIAMLLSVYGSQPLSKFWYAWMALGVYLAVPIVNVFLKNAKTKEVEYFVVVFLIASLIYPLCYSLGIKIALDLYFFIGPISYVILGYYLSRKEFTVSSNKIILISFIVFILISAYRVFNYQLFFLNNHMMLYSQLDLALPQVIQVASVFLIFKYLYESRSGIFAAFRGFLENDYVNSLMVSVSRASYGMYLLHMILLRGWIEPYFKAIHMTGIETAVSIVILSIALFIISWMIILVLGKIPYVNKISGYH